MAHTFHANESRSRLLARLVREILSAPGAEFESLASLVEALKARCAKLRIPWTNDDISEALRLIASNVPLPSPRVLSKYRVALPEERPISRAEASAILLRLGVKL